MTQVPCHLRCGSVIRRLGPQVIPLPLRRTETGGKTRGGADARRVREDRRERAVLHVQPVSHPVGPGSSRRRTTSARGLAPNGVAGAQPTWLGRAVALRWPERLRWPGPAKDYPDGPRSGLLLATGACRMPCTSWDTDAARSEEDVTRSLATVRIDAASVEPRWTAPEAEVAAFNARLTSPDFLDVARYPEVTFRSKRIDKVGPAYRLIGDLSLHGVATRRAT